MRKIIILTSILVVAVFAVAILYFSKLDLGVRNNDKALARIPASAALVLEFRNDNTFAEIFKDYHLFDALLGEQKTANLRQLNELFLLNPKLAVSAADQNAFLSLHHTGDADVELLWVLTLNNKQSASELYDLLLQPSGEYSSKKIGLAGSDVLEIRINKLRQAFYLFFSKGLAIGSFSKELVSKSLDDHGPKIPAAFISAINKGSNSRTSSPINLFINHAAVPTFLSAYFNTTNGTNAALLKNLGGYSSLNMNFKSDALMFNGISTIDTSGKSYLRLFLNQVPVKTDILKILPSSTANYLTFGISDNLQFFGQLQKLLEKRNELSRLKTQFALMRNTSGVDVDTDLAGFWGHEFSIVQLADQQKLALISVTDGSRLLNALEPVSTSYSSDIRQFNNANICYYFFGDPLKQFSRPYYAIKDNFMIVANTAATVQQYLNDYSNRNLLMETPEFSAFNQYIANQSNISFFAHTRNSRNIIKSSMRNSFAGLFENEAYGLKKFYGISYQWSSDRDHFFTNLYASYADTSTNKLREVWKHQLNARAAIPPQVFNLPSGEHLVLVQDKANNLYAISADGERKWATQLDGKILGDMKQATDGSFVLATPLSLYRFATDGSITGGFPVKLTQNASYGPTLSQTGPAEQIFVPCGDKISAYTLTGSNVEGWDHTFSSKIMFDLKPGTLDGTACLVATTQNGNVNYLFLNGKIGATIAVSDRPIANPLVKGYEDTFSTSDTSGSVHQLFADKKTRLVTFGNWSPKHYFATANLSGDDQDEFVFVDKNQLSVFNADNSSAYNFEFRYNITTRPQFFPIGRSVFQTGISSAEDDLLYLFNDIGTLVRGFPVKGLPGFYVGDLKNDGLRYLICGTRDNYLYVYKL